MSYSRRWSSTRTSVNWAAHHRAQRARVSAEFGGIDQSVVRAFYQLRQGELDEVFRLYAQQFGASAASYALSAYQKWRIGSVQPSALTLHRLLEIVPRVLDFAAKLELYRQLRNAHRKREAINLRLTYPIADQLNLVVAETWRVVEHARAQPIPEVVSARLTWLSHGDGMAARQLVSAIELEEGQQVAAMLREELTTLLSATELSGISPRIQHVIELPHGTVTLEITEKKKWKWPMTKKESEHENTLPALVDDRSLARPIGDIIDQALEQGGSEEIARAAQIEALRLAAKQRESAMDSTAANREIVEFLEQVHDASTVRDMDFSADADFKRASGRTHMRVERKRRWWPFG